MTNEATIQAQVRLEAAKRGWKLWRNNVGVLVDATGRPIRYGLGNDSKAVNENFKSADLIGLRPVFITRDMVGSTIGQFVSIECKSPTGRVHEGQHRWALMVREAGGWSYISRGELP